VNDPLLTAEMNVVESAAAALAVFGTINTTEPAEQFGAVTVVDVVDVASVNSPVALERPRPSSFTANTTLRRSRSLESRTRTLICRPQLQNQALRL
jgi:hypothetical protein